MPTGYQGYAGYGDPERAKVDRARQMAELLSQGATDTSPKSFWEGAAQLGKAFIARGANERADQAESAYADSRKKQAETLFSTTFADPAAANAPLSLVPGSAAGTAADLGRGVDNQRYADIARSMYAINGGDANAALLSAQGLQRQAVEDARYTDTTKYARGRDAKQDEQWQKSFDQSGTQFDATMGFNRDQFGETKRHNQVVERLSAEELAAKKAREEAAANGGAVFEGPQLAAIYNKNMDALDEVNAAQKDLDFIAGQSQAFVDQAEKGGYWAQGEGWINDWAQAWSMDTTKLKSITDSIAPIMRRPGSGSSSDRDVEMFKSAVTNINNTPEANKRFAQGAQQMADRNRAYGQFLNDAITPGDPQSRQKAQKIWSLYTKDQPIFDEKTGNVMQPKAFQEWLAEQMGQPAPATSQPTGFWEKLAPQQSPQGRPMQPARPTQPAADDLDSLVNEWLK